MKRIFLIAILLLTQQVVFAQNSLIFSGRVYDNSTKEPLPYATISIPHTGTGVISNEFGEFTYHLPDSIENSVVEISFLGFETSFVKVRSIVPGSIHQIGMIPKTIEIDEVEIAAKELISAEKLVWRSIRKISRNYPKNRFQLYGYYRDYIRDLNSNDYNNLTEAAVIIEDKGYNANDYKETKIKIEQIRYNPLLASDTSLNIGYDGMVKYVPNADISGANDLALLMFHNPVRNHKINTFSFVYILDESFLENHEFHYKTITKDDSLKIYEISFNTDTLLGWEDDSEYIGEGAMHINSDDLAILKFNYFVNSNSRAFTGKLMEVRLEYKKYQDKYYLSYLSMDNYFEITYKTFGMYRPKIEHLYQYRELFINKIITEPDQPISDEEAIEKGKILIGNRVSEIPGFWEDYNYTINERLIED